MQTEAAMTAVLDMIVETAKTEWSGGSTTDLLAFQKARSESILKLSEAYAWLKSHTLSFRRSARACTELLMSM